MSRMLDENNISFDEDANLRPQLLKEYVGQEQLKDNYRIFIEAAKQRNEILDHVLLYGPPGLGKTTLAHVIANEMNGTIKSANAPSMDHKKDIVALLSSLDAGDFLFIDEIHRLNKQSQELLYPAMEDYCIDIIIGKDATNKRILHLDLPPFTLIGATTRIGDISSPMRDRFGIVSQLQYYDNNDLQSIIKRTASVMQVLIDDKSVDDIAKRSRGTPRIANRIFRRIRDFAQVYNSGVIDQSITAQAFAQLSIDELGLDEVDLRYLNAIIDVFNGGPVGVDALASSIQEETSTIEDVYEPYLLQNGFISRTRSGRIANDKAYKHLKKSKPV